MDLSQGFKIVTDFIDTKNNTKLLWIIGIITFFMSAVLDNLTSTIVMISLLRKLIKVRQGQGSVYALRFGLRWRLYFPRVTVGASGSKGGLPLEQTARTVRV